MKPALLLPVCPIEGNVNQCSTLYYSSSSCWSLVPWLPLLWHSLGAELKKQLGDERQLDAPVKIPRSWGSLRDLPSPTRLYCTVVSSIPVSGIDIVLVKLKHWQGEN